MTVDAQSVVEGPFAPNGATTEWPFTFTAQDPGEVSLVRVSPAGGVVEVEGGIALDPGGGGTVTVDPPLGAGGDLYILLVPSFAQTTAFEAQGAFSPVAMNTALDRAAARDQYLKARLDRAVLAPLGSDGLDAGAIVAAIEGVRDASLAAVEASVQAYVQANLNLADRTLAWIAACAAAGSVPSIGRAALMDRVIRRLLAIDAFDWCAGLFLVGETKAQTLVNIAAPATLAAEDGGSLAFVADRYICGGGVVAVDTNVAIPSAAYAQDSAFLLVRQVSNTQGSDNRMIGGRQSRAYVVPSSDGGHLRVAANAMAADSTAEFTPNGVGAYGFIRRDATGFTPMLGKTEGAVIARASTSLALAGNEIILLGGGSMRGVGQGFYFAFGTAPTLAQWRGLIDALELYGREVGAFL